MKQLKNSNNSPVHLTVSQLQLSANKSAEQEQEITNTAVPMNIGPVKVANVNKVENTEENHFENLNKALVATLSTTIQGNTKG